MSRCELRLIADDGRGNIYYPGLASDIRVIAGSYLDCRRKGMPEPKADKLHIVFHFKVGCLNSTLWFCRNEVHAVRSAAIVSSLSAALRFAEVTSACGRYTY